MYSARLYHRNLRLKEKIHFDHSFRNFLIIDSHLPVIRVVWIYLVLSAVNLCFFE